MPINYEGIDISVVADFDVDDNVFDVLAVDADIVNVEVDVFTSFIQFKYLISSFM